ncbi:MAG: 6-phosphofructokinase [Chloroflexota bacterium]
MRTLIVVNGGDAPGINALIARFISMANRNGDEVCGGNAGFAGVLRDEIRPLSLADVGPVAGHGGSILTSTREPALAKDEARDRLTAILKRHSIDNILLFGGNGTLTYIPPRLRQWGVPVIGIPTTIDNDVAGTDRTLGFDSACNYAYQAVEGVLATARALPGRIFMVETLGGDTGYIALDVAMGAGAHAVLVPEYDYSDEWLAHRLRDAIESDGHALVVLSEGVKKIPQMPEMIPRMTGVRLRYTRLGHAQRGGTVSHADRRLAMDMARLAHHALRRGITSGTVIVRNGQMMVYEDDIQNFELSPPNRAEYDFVNGF